MNADCLFVNIKYDIIFCYFFSCNRLTARLSFACVRSSFVSLGFFENFHPNWECNSVLMAAGVSPQLSSFSIFCLFFCYTKPSTYYYGSNHGPPIRVLTSLDNDGGNEELLEEKRLFNQQKTKRGENFHLH